MLELDLQAVLKTVCPQVVMGVAPSGTKTPYITWQHIGGDPLIFLDNAQADKRNALIQINAYHSTGLAALQLLQVVQAALAGIYSEVRRPSAVGAHSGPRRRRRGAGLLANSIDYRDAITAPAPDTGLGRFFCAR